MKDFAILAAFLLLSGCVIDYTISEAEEAQDDTEHRDSVSMVARMKESRDTTTTGTPIGFDVTVDEWDEGEDVEL